jgi:hypothetical protein
MARIRKILPPCEICGKRLKTFHQEARHHICSACHNNRPKECERLYGVDRARQEAGHGLIAGSAL